MRYFRHLYDSMFAELVIGEDTCWTNRYLQSRCYCPSDL